MLGVISPATNIYIVTGYIDKRGGCGQNSEPYSSSEFETVSSFV